MISRLLARLGCVLSLVAGSAAPALAGQPVESILRLALEPIVADAMPLAPNRLRGDFAARLDAILLDAEAPLAAVDTSASAAAEPATPAATVPVTPSRPLERQPSVVWPLLGGAVGCVGGTYGGAILGYLILGEDDGEFGGPGDVIGVLGGAAVGNALLTPLGVHLGNARKGSYSIDLLTAVLSGALGLGVSSLADHAFPGVLAGAAMQVAAVTYVERRVGADRIASRQSTGSP
jgi:hypothetical protein